MIAFRLALVQLTPCYDKEKNVERALAMVAEAASGGARIVALPEIFYHPFELDRLAGVADRDDRTIDSLRNLASKLGIHLCTGSIARIRDGAVYNTSFLLGASGEILLEYSKSHLFDVDFRGLRVTESRVFTPGNSIAVARTAFCTAGIMICYDVRFPEVARELAVRGAEVIFVPAAFNRITGPAHWHVMMRARAIENQVYLAAISQGRNNESAYQAYGHSLVCSPWGELLVEADEDERIIYADLSPGQLERTRSRMPLLGHRRADMYDLWRHDGGSGSH